MTNNAPAIALKGNILEEFTDSIRQYGLIGEDRNAKLIYLALVTRMLTKPVSIVVKGVSSGGKSYTVETVLLYFPASAYYAKTAMSDKALVYSKEPLKNRILVIYEASGMESGFMAYAVRSLLSESKLSYEFVSKGETKVVEKEGPTGLIVTTTKSSLHPENETRMLSLFVADTPEQTRNVLVATAEQKDPDFDFSAWREFQVFLEGSEKRVVIRYAGTLAELIPATSPRLRRDWRQVLSLIEAHAIIHQQTRERDKGGRIVASIEDYAVVHDLIADLISQGVEATVSEGVRETVNAVSVLSRSHPQGVSYKVVGDYLNLDKSSAKRRCGEAIRLGYIRNHQQRRNQPAQLFIGDPLPENMDILPSPKVLQEVLEHGCTVASESMREAVHAHAA